MRKKSKKKFTNRNLAIHHDDIFVLTLLTEGEKREGKKPLKNKTFVRTLMRKGTKKERKKIEKLHNKVFSFLLI